MVTRITARTIGTDVVSVQPMSSPYSNSEGFNKIIAETKTINRDKKLDSILNDEEYQEMKVEDHPDYPLKLGKLVSGGLFYMDYKYNNNKNP